MPSSRPETIPPVVSLVRQMNPASILDVGTGFGKWGVLFREYTDIAGSEKDPARYRKENWRVRIEGIEGFRPYLTPLHDYAYDRVHVGDALAVLPRLGRYDLIFLGDVIEHFDKPAGRKLVEEALGHALGFVVLTTPRRETSQGARAGNEMEIHRSLWSARDFRAIAPADTYALPADVLLAVYAKPGRPRLRPRANAPRPAPGNMLRRAARRILGNSVYAALRNRLRRRAGGGP